MPDSSSGFAAGAAAPRRSVSRRAFVAAATGGAAATMVHSARAAGGETRELRLGVIGCGGRGSGAINANTAWSIELTSYAAVPEWGGQRVDFRTEENAFFDGKTVRFIDGRQTELTLIK